jgi:hypothetical protein
MGGPQPPCLPQLQTDAVAHARVVQRAADPLHRPRSSRNLAGFALCLAAACLARSAIAWRLEPPWTEKHWCQSVINPEWPFIYQKSLVQLEETKGRFAFSVQDMRHVCVQYGARTKCHICEDIQCGPGLSETCAFQIQGVDWTGLPTNIPSTTDTPFAVGPLVTHRNDFGNASSVCVHIGSGACVASATSTFDSCPLRCWGADSPVPPVPTAVGWTYNMSRGQPQGRLFTITGSTLPVFGNLPIPMGFTPRAGTPSPGFQDGLPNLARFRSPQAIAVANDGAVFVADTKNHAIRRIDPLDKRVVTVAGRPESGYADGSHSSARFSSPSGIAVWHDCSGSPCRVVVVVSDTYNHRIREIRGADTLPGGTGVDLAAVVVRTIAGGGALLPPSSEIQGWRDGQGAAARFDTPFGVVADDSGNIFVADTLNFAIRFIDPSDYVHTLAGNLRRSPREGPGCPAPCIEGVQGTRDGNRTFAQFYHPYDVALGENGTVIVSDADRIRRITRLDGTFPLGQSTIQGVTSFDRVVTIAGGLEDGERDGIGQRARLDKPRGVTMTQDGRIYLADSSGCRIRRITPADHVAKPASCSDRLVDLWRPRGCESYDPPIDSVGEMATAVSGNIEYNRDHPKWNARSMPVNCLASAPPDLGRISSGVTSGPQGGTSSIVLDVQEDTGDESTIRILCPVGCSSNADAAPSALEGDHFYTETSPICLAAVHAGVLPAGQGGLITAVLKRGWGVGVAGVGSPGYNAGPIPASTRHGVASAALVSASRTFIVEPYNLSLVEVQTIAGLPNAPIDDPCGFTDDQPPLAARLHGPTAVAVRPAANSLDAASELLYIADTVNHAVRALTATCSRPCENGGVCVAPELCQCPSGWTGVDCSQPVCSSGCSSNQICTGPDACSCKAGFTGFPACSTPQCVQTCVHGRCSAPDTCTCDMGWFDANCTTPVCSQTCGNGANCTAPDTCTCPKEWQGADCRTPVCDQVCLNGASCVAPNTCMCQPGWSGHDCSKPVCDQGFFVPDPTPEHYAPSSWREPYWDMYTPCNITEWCASTNEFDCAQLDRSFVHWPVSTNRSHTGRKVPPALCMPLEVAVDAVTHYRYETEFDNITDYWRRTPLQPYGWGPTNTSHVWSSPSQSASDRQIALAFYQRVTQGVYVCANGGNCTAPGLCKCAPGWVGFDCRTPVCDVGYFYRNRLSFEPLTAGQGTYQCSTRAVTVWENPRTDWKYVGYVHEHPNYYSRHMDGGIGWVPVHEHKPPLGDSTVEGWRRDGWWERVPGTVWRHEYNCIPTFNRTCPSDVNKTRDLATFLYGVPTPNTTHSFLPRVLYSDKRVTADGRWEVPGGECIDEVLLGCFNGGTCVAPNQCKCAPGWQGHDCSLPICEQTVSEVTGVTGDPFLPVTLLRSNDPLNRGAPDPLTPPSLPGDRFINFRHCPNNGNCTHPNTCTCEMGWSGYDCTIPLCAQECFNGGNCTAPDTCTCSQWENAFRDKRGEPYFRRSDGDPQLTGWTGYDCNTPICVQAQRWVPNDEEGTVRLVATINDGVSFQGGCPSPARFTPPGRTRTAVELCGKEEWWQGSWTNSWDYQRDTSFRSPGRLQRVNHPNFVQIDADSWVEGDKITGEGIYACFNRGSCVAPDTCECEAGRWEGFDCNIPICTFTDLFGLTRGCSNGAVCAAPDECDCTTVPSLLPEVHPDLEVTQTNTGWMGDDCSIPICVQGFFDPECRDVPPGGSAGPAAMGQGCWRCANGGNCTAPDVCECPPEWTGYDCRTPVCTQHATQDIIADLNTVDPAKITAFELDPCMTKQTEVWNGRVVGRGNCSAPNTCTCLCKERSWLDADGNLVEEPWTDLFRRTIPAGSIYGNSDCLDGYQGALNEDGSFRSCHLTIYVPTWFERNTLSIIIITGASIFVLFVIYLFVRRKLRQRFLAMKAEKRRSRRSSSENSTKQ